MHIGILWVAAMFVALGIFCAALVEHVKLHTLYSVPNMRRRFSALVTLVLFSAFGGVMGVTAGIMGFEFSPPTFELFSIRPPLQSGLRAAFLFSCGGLGSYLMTGAAIASLFEKVNAPTRPHAHDDPPDRPFQGPLKGA